DVTQVIGQAGQVTTNQTGSAQWHTITFDATILNPVIKLAMNTTNDTDPMTLRVRNVTDTGFQWQIDEYEYLDGVHGSETVSWMAVAQGTHTLDDGTIIQANTTTATNNNWTNITFNSAFGSSPVIMTQIMTVNEGTAAVLHNENRTSTGFRVQIEEQENFGTGHATETIGWIAIDNGGSVANGFLVGETSNSVTHSTTTVNFGSSFASNSPVVLIDMQTEDGGDTAVSRGITISSSSISFNIDEETSRDAETNHTTEVVGYYATTNGLIYADGNNGNDSLSGGDGLDTLYGGDGADTFIFEAASAYNDIDQIVDFRYGQGDALDISDLLTGFSGTITDYVNFVDSGSDILVQVDGNGLTGGTSFTTIGQLNNVTNLDEALLYAAGGIIV
ncbi:MAG: type I secretion C-terminal target domain-containing protein, partial [Alphaproteobacteria bacterium]|nr:type I secretion C-terminal target domain-containing protein [Alphaproteobacteria bacterium]